MQVYHIPKVIMQRHQPTLDQMRILEFADHVAQKRFGVPSALLSREERDIILDYVGEMLAELDALHRGQAS
jgi:hypothetical protein